ncbi:hypothetical protein [Bacillus thuringiensis]|uniref:Uncharacterized protein n=1 Tax=Bacillus thuringiensis TaxID=1428 RepID=A0AAW4I131_BACTU|nr:hypothetical protein [Bacillus thuringiensis]MBN9901107.1 hypothetical protein [Bacillus thuringiensis]MDY7522174.1 hypothetical protein [Bacillus thuringiensis]
MRLYILEITTEHKISFINATSIEKAIEAFKRIYKHYEEQVPFYVREIHPSEKIIMDTISGEIHCIGDNSVLKKCLENLMHLYTPINWVPTLVLYQDIKTDPISFTIHKACLIKGSPEYNEVGMDVWKSALQVSLDDHREVWNALKTFLHIQVLSVFELEQVIKVNEIR